MTSPGQVCWWLRMSKENFSALLIKRKGDVGFNASASTPLFLKCVAWEMWHVFVHGEWHVRSDFPLGSWSCCCSVPLHCLVESRVISLSFPLWLCSLCWDRGIPCSDGRLPRSLSCMCYWHFTLLWIICLPSSTLTFALWAHGWSLAGPCSHSLPSKLGKNVWQVLFWGLAIVQVS